VIFAHADEDIRYMLMKLIEENKKRGLNNNVNNTGYVCVGEKLQI
jgi:hypothetical protein